MQICIIPLLCHRTQRRQHFGRETHLGLPPWACAARGNRRNSYMVAAGLIYLSERPSKDELPRYRDIDSAPKWLRPSLSESPPSFLLCGPDEPALEVHTPSQECECELPGVAAIICPGGGYEHLAPHEGKPAAAWLNRLGVVCFILRYRLVPQHPWPAPLHDVRAAMKILQGPDAASRWNIAPSRLLLVGFSAGAHLVAQACTADGVRATVLVYPALVDAGDIATISVLEELAARNGGTVPIETTHVYVVASTNDGMLPPESHADPMVKGLMQIGVNCTYQRTRLGMHGFGVTKKWALPCRKWLLNVFFSQERADG